MWAIHPSPPAKGAYMLEMAILGLLKEQPMHGYQLSKELAETLGGFRRVSYGSLYPTLRRLEKAGEVQVEQSAETSARRKNVYKITPAGEIAFEEMLTEGGPDAGDDSKFGVRLAFFRYLKPETRIRLLERRRAILEERLATTQSKLAKTREQIDTYTLSMMTHGEDTTRSDIAWLDELIAAERNSVLAGANASTTGSTVSSTRPSSASIKTRAQARKARRRNQ